MESRENNPNTPGSDKVTKTQTTSNRSYREHISKVRLITIALVVLGVLFVGGYFIYNNIQKNEEPYKYSQLKGVSLGSIAKSPGAATIKVPKEFEPDKALKSVVTPESSEMDLAHTAQGTLSGIIILSQIANPTILSQGDIDSLTLYLYQPNSDTYKEYLNSIKTFTVTRTSKVLKLDFGKTESFSNKNLAMSQNFVHRAWAFDLTGSSKSEPTTNYKGKFIYAVSQKNTYYLLLAVKESDWNSNQSVWDQVLNSFNIKQ